LSAKQLSHIRSVVEALYVEYKRLPQDALFGGYYFKEFAEDCYRFFKNFAEVDKD
jgi:hypothetical protein